MIIVANYELMTRDAVSAFSKTLLPESWSWTDCVFFFATPNHGKRVQSLQPCHFNSHWSMLFCFFLPAIPLIIVIALQLLFNFYCWPCVVVAAI